MPLSAALRYPRSTTACNRGAPRLRRAAATPYSRSMVACNGGAPHLSPPSQWSKPQRREEKRGRSGRESWSTGILDGARE
ncbi:unnamed protein product [Linum trigynum]|uniref:Uncharacterized protein n=1 Tax=Linum trigynum TaxID=586398 RepID=A0AAV2GK88_9ROSI